MRGTFFLGLTTSYLFFLWRRVRGVGWGLVTPRTKQYPLLLTHVRLSQHHWCVPFYLDVTVVTGNALLALLSAPPYPR